MDPFRSLLFVPGNRARFLEKAVGVDADGLVPDLESGVPDPEKERARGMIREALPRLAREGRQVFVRVNAVDSKEIWDDLNAVITPALSGVLVPEIDAPDDIWRLDELLTSLERGKGLPYGHVRVIAFIESPLGIVRAFEIATASSRLIALAFGAEDFTSKMGVPRTKDGTELLFARNQVAVGAEAAHKVAIDAPFPDVSDAAGLARDTQTALHLGFKGKLAIHPNQVPTINRTFSPSAEDIEQAKRIVMAFERAEAQGLGTCSVDGKMVDTSIALRAQKLLRTAQTVAAHEESGR